MYYVKIVIRSMIFRLIIEFQRVFWTFWWKPLGSWVIMFEDKKKIKIKPFLLLLRKSFYSRLVVANFLCFTCFIFLQTKSRKCDICRICFHVFCFVSCLFTNTVCLYHITRRIFLLFLISISVESFFFSHSSTDNMKHILYSK